MTTIDDDRRRAILGMVSECIEGLLELQDLLEVKRGHGLPLEPDWMVALGLQYGDGDGDDTWAYGRAWDTGCGHGDGFGRHYGDAHPLDSSGWGLEDEA